MQEQYDIPEDFKGVLSNKLKRMTETGKLIKVIYPLMLHCNLCKCYNYLLPDDTVLEKIKLLKTCRCLSFTLLKLCRFAGLSLHLIGMYCLVKWFFQLK